MSNAAGDFPIKLLNNTETEVVDKVMMARSGFLAWYRNPARPSGDGRAVAWQDAANNWRRMCPEFIFFHQQGGRPP